MKYLAIILFCISTHFARAYNPFWTQLDRNLISHLVKIDKGSIQSFEKYFESSKRSKDLINLGFGWKVWSPAKSGGYISIGSDFFYFNDSLVSIEIHGELPDEKVLRKKYLKWYNDFFSLNENGDLTPFSFNIKSVSGPISNIADSLKFVELRKQVSSLMRPSSSLYYYWAGGYSGSMPANRKLFLENSDSLSFTELNYMTYSINPITRFMAIEEIIRKNYIESECNQKDIEWYESCFKEVPYVKTLNGCMGSAESSKNLVYMFSQMEYH